MANDEHLAVLGRGVRLWNDWRHENRSVRPDLSGADLSGADLTPKFGDMRDVTTGADFSGADLSGANLSDAILTIADLSGADLIDAKLSNAHLSDADLSGANFSRAYLDSADLRDALLHRADLSGADLSRAYLRGANLSLANLRLANLLFAELWGADLSGADLSDAYLGPTLFAGCDLSETQGLDSCRHVAPSVIDHRTLQWSGPLPLSFLRGCGLPDNLIDYLPSLLNQPIQFYSCFISYSSKNDAFARRLHADLQNEGIRCWFAPEDMKIGDRTRTRIDEAIRLHEKLLLVLSKNSINSDWVEKEVETAFEKERETKSPVLFPIRLDAAVMKSGTGWAADIKRTRHIGDFSRWKDHDAYQKGLRRLLHDMTIEREPT